MDDSKKTKEIELEKEAIEILSKHWLSVTKKPIDDTILQHLDYVIKAMVEIAKNHQVESDGVPLDKLLNAIDEYVLEQKNHQLTRTPERMSTIECVAHWCKQFAIGLNRNGGQPPLNIKMPPSRRKHHEMIKCPECKKLQIAIVQHTVPFFTYIHECCECKYTIMESEWDKID